MPMDAPGSIEYRFSSMMWSKRTINLPKNFPVSARPGNNVFIANRGDVSFEYPSSWVVKPSDKSICFYDANPPDDQCVLEFSITHLDFRRDWSDLPLASMLCKVLPPGHQAGPAQPWDVQQLIRGDLQIVWLESDFMDPVEHRLALARCALARCADIVPLITFNFWPEHKQKWEPIWQSILETLRVAHGPRFKSRN
jgi:hypothetical protein